MSRLYNTYKHLENNTTIILVTKSDDSNYLKEYLIDTEDLLKLKKVRVGKNGYGFCGDKNIANLIIGLDSSRKTVIDHINNNIFDNRKQNLRVLSAKDNACNRSKSLNNTGIVGISKRNKDNYFYFRVSVSDRNSPIENSKNGACIRYTKNFNINVLGEEDALKQAKEWLYEKRKEFNYVDY